MCNCATHGRDLSETQDGKYPMSNHAPSCEDFKAERFHRIENDGTFCIMEPDAAAEFVADSDEEYSVTAVYLTRDQFEKLDEFQGF